MSLEVGDVIKPLFYSSEKYRTKRLKALTYEDRGEIEVIEDGLIFHGKKNEIKMKNIIQITRVSSKTKKLGDWIQVSFRNNDDAVDVANFIKIDNMVLIGDLKEYTNKLYLDLLDIQSKWKVTSINKEIKEKEEIEEESEIEDKLKKLKGLFDKELISEEEYNKKKEELLEKL